MIWNAITNIISQKSIFACTTKVSALADSTVFRALTAFQNFFGDLMLRLLALYFLKKTVTTFVAFFKRFVTLQAPINFTRVAFVVSQNSARKTLEAV